MDSILEDEYLEPRRRRDRDDDGDVLDSEPRSKGGAAYDPYALDDIFGGPAPQSTGDPFDDGFDSLFDAPAPPRHAGSAPAAPTQRDPFESILKDRAEVSQEPAGPVARDPFESAVMARPGLPGADPFANDPLGDIGDGLDSAETFDDAFADSYTDLPSSLPTSAVTADADTVLGPDPVPFDDDPFQPPPQDSSPSRNPAGPPVRVRIPDAPPPPPLGAPGTTAERRGTNAPPEKKRGPTVAPAPAFGDFERRYGLDRPESAADGEETLSGESGYQEDIERRFGTAAQRMRDKISQRETAQRRDQPSRLPKLLLLLGVVSLVTVGAVLGYRKWAEDQAAERASRPSEGVASAQLGRQVMRVPTPSSMTVDPGVQLPPLPPAVDMDGKVKRGLAFGLPLWAPPGEAAPASKEGSK
ncbi:MAG: hypothetical protein ACYS22_03690 [Planctomycetota bacterium]